jgi:hypothetical protein
MGIGQYINGRCDVLVVHVTKSGKVDDYHMVNGY